MFRFTITVTLTVLSTTALLSGCASPPDYPPYPPRTLTGWQPHSPDDEALYATPYRLVKWNRSFELEMLIEGRATMVTALSFELMSAIRVNGPDWLEIRDARTKRPIALQRRQAPKRMTGAFITPVPPAPTQPTSIPDYEYAIERLWLNIKGSLPHICEVRVRPDHPAPSTPTVFNTEWVELTVHWDDPWDDDPWRQ